MTQNQISYAMNKRTLARLTNKHKTPPKCECGCNTSIKEGDQVHVTTRHHIYLLEHYQRLLH